MGHGEQESVALARVLMQAMMGADQVTDAATAEQWDLLLGVLRRKVG